jgi:hypothetical protein
MRCESRTGNSSTTNSRIHELMHPQQAPVAARRMTPANTRPPHLHQSCSVPSIPTDLQNLFVNGISTRSHVSCLYEEQRLFPAVQTLFADLSRIRRGRRDPDSRSGCRLRTSGAWCGAPPDHDDLRKNEQKARGLRGDRGSCPARRIAFEQCERPMASLKWLLRSKTVTRNPRRWCSLIMEP